MHEEQRESKVYRATLVPQVLKARQVQPVQRVGKEFRVFRASKEFREFRVLKEYRAIPAQPVPKAQPVPVALKELRAILGHRVQPVQLVLPAQQERAFRDLPAQLVPQVLSAQLAMEVVVEPLVLKVRKVRLVRKVQLVPLAQQVVGVAEELKGLLVLREFKVPRAQLVPRVLRVHLDLPVHLVHQLAFRVLKDQQDQLVL